MRRSLFSCPPRPRGLGLGVAVAAALTLASCASVLGADFGDEQLAAAGDAGASDTSNHADAGPKDEAAVGTCPQGQSNCGGLCFDIQTDPRHCGGCSTDCPDDPNGPGVCVAASCALACAAGWVRCVAGCCDADSGMVVPLDSGNSDPGIPCGSAFCPVSGASYCCGQWLDGPGGDVCSTSSSANCSWEFSCDDASECPAGSVCCYDDTATASSCAFVCDAPQDAVLCNPNSSGACPSGMTCSGTFTRAALQTVYGACQ